MATTSFHVNMNDLDFIFKQIKIAEAHSGGITLTQAIMESYGVSASDANLVPAGLRTVSGTLNNLVNPAWGAADTPFPRITDPAYINDNDGDSIDFDGPGGMDPLVQGNYGNTGNVVDSDPRTISNLIVNQTIDNPAAVAAWFGNPLSMDAFHERYGADAIALRPGAAAMLTVNDASFEMTDLSTPGGAVVGSPLGNYTIGAPAGWALAGTGGLFAPTDAVSETNGHDGANVAWLNGGAVLSQDFDVNMLEGQRYELSLRIGDRTDMVWGSGEARLIAFNGATAVVLSTQALPDPTDGQWAGVSFDSGAIGAAYAGWDLRVEVANTGGTQILVDNVEIKRFNTNEFEVDNTDLSSIPNQSPDIGLSPGFNAWMTFFGQFFDHGLDLVTKADNGTVFIPLNADDPLIAGADGRFGTADDLPTHLQFMAVTRARVDINGDAENTTTPFVDQNQTYTSHPSHHVFLREYVMVDGKPMATGKLLDSTIVPGALATWGEVKAQALTKLGIELDDLDVHSAPLLVTDEYGEFLRGPNGFPLVVMQPSNMTQEGSIAAPVDATNAVQTEHQFLVDIAHHAAPSAGQTADADSDVVDDHDPTTYDNEMLEAHFITGDGRGNENIALTTVHSVFHAEHNRMVGENQKTILEAADLAGLNEWLLVDVAALPANQAEIDALVWDGERLFQAARFVTEMQYQHLVFEEFARRIQPNVDPFVFTHSPDMDASIIAEFAHTVYRFGHSMLNQTVDRLDNDLNMVNGETEQATLIEAFLNPQMFAASGANVGEIIANIARGATLSVGNEMDEFVVPALQTNLLGLPLDLAAINIARGRENGVKSLNEIRKEFYEDYGLADVKPYTSWIDFAQHMKHPESIVNFIAAYGTHALIDAAESLAEKRAVALSIVTGVDADWIDQASGTSGTAVAPLDRVAFLNATGGYATTALGGMNNVDFWIGGLAEELNEFGGMLGSTFNFVFEYQMEHLQTGDRFYYLSRTQGLNLLDQLEPNTFTDLVMRNSTLSNDYATHLNGNLFVTPDYIFELDRMIAQPHGDLLNDPEHDNAFLQLIDPKVERDYSTTITDINGHDVGGMIRFSGGEHVVLGGTEGNDSLYGDKGIDALWGDGGDDYLNAGMEADQVFGGDGNDIIEDPFGDDILRGGDGDDVISAGTGLDIVFGDNGSDFLIMGQDDKEGFGGEGNDWILGGTGNEGLLGGGGDDWIEGGPGFDVISGENSELFFNSPIIGHDILWGQGNDQDYDSESGDDIMLSGPGIQRFEGQFGFDWAIAKYDVAGAKFDFQIPIFSSEFANILRDRFDLVEAASGWKLDDYLQGDDRGHSGGSSSPDSAPEAAFTDHVLDNAGIDRIDGLRDFLGLQGVADASFKNGNILIGGDGSDVLRGRGGYDTLDGDAWLNVRIQIDMGSGVFYTAESLTSDTSAAGPNAGKVMDMSGNIMFGGRSISSLLLDRTITTSQMSAVREILYADGSDDIDTAVFQGTRPEYNIEGLDDITIDGVTYAATGVAEDLDMDGFITVEDRDNGVIGAVVGGVQLGSRGALTDDTDKIRNIEHLEFADQILAIGGNNAFATGIVTIHDDTPFDRDGAGPLPALVTPYVGQVLTAALTDVMDADGVTLDVDGNPVGLTFDWQTTEVGSNAGWSTIQSSLSYTVRSVDPGHILRAVAVFKDDNGVTERIFSSPTDAPTAAFNVAENSADGTIVGLQVPFSVDYDPLAIGTAAPVDVDLTTLHHEIDPANDAGGRFTVILNGLDIDGFPRYSVVVADGASAIDYETQDQYQTVDNQYQIVINTYDQAGGILVASRQFTILIGDVADEAPSDIQWSAVAPVGNQLPGIGVIAMLETSDDNHTTGFVYTLEPGTSPGFSISPLGEVSRTGSALAQNTSYALIVTSTAPDGKSHTETFNIRTGSNGANDFTIQTTSGDDIFFARGGDDIGLNGGNGNDSLFGQGGADLMNGGNGNDVLDGGSGNDTLDGGAGNDILAGGLNQDSVNGGAGDDRIIWNSNASGATDNRDLIDGGAGSDTFELNGRAGLGETFRIYTRAEAILAGATGLAADTEIVVTRGGAMNPATFNNRIIAELDNIEEIVVNSLDVSANDGDGPPNGGPSDGDTIQVIGNFNAPFTSLDFSTITINGNSGDDTVDISALSSAHRIVFRSNGGNDTIIGTLRPQDTVELPAGTAPEDYVTTVGADGWTTMTDGTHSVRFLVEGGLPEIITTGNGTADAPVSPPLTGTAEPETLIADATANMIFAGGGDDNILAGDGPDMVFGDGGNDRLFGEEGDDFLEGGAGNDLVVGGAGDDIIVATTGDGDDRYYGDDIAGGSGSDTLDMSSIMANVTADLGSGMMGRGSVYSADSGHDTIWNVENIVTGAGDDVIIANASVNVIDGGDGNDVFRFNAAEDADGDTIVTFQPGDKIDLSGMDANGSSAGNQAFTLVTDALTDRGQIMVTAEMRGGDSYTVVEGNLSGDTGADFKLSIKGNHTLTEADFTL